MSLQPNCPLPSDFGERFFRRLTAIYGAQKVGAMWAGAPKEEVWDLWTRRLSRYPAGIIAHAIEALIDHGKEWPPTLPEFDELCRQLSQTRSAMRSAIPAPRRPKPEGYQLPSFPNLGAAERFDGLRWLRRVGSLSVARALLVQATTDWRVAKILERHIERDFADVQSPEARTFLRAWAKENPDWTPGDLAPEDRVA